MLQRRSQAFSLLELMIVIAIMSIIAGIAVPNYLRTREQAKLASCKRNLVTIAEAIEIFRNSPAGSQEAFFKTAGGVINNDSILVGEGYLKVPPRCPTNNTDYYSWSVQEENGKVTFLVLHSVHELHRVSDIHGQYPIYDEAHGGILDE